MTDPDLRTLAVSLYREGAAWADIVEITGLTRGTVQAHLRRIREPARPRVTLPRDEIVAAYESGVSANRLAQRYGSSRRTMERYLDAWGVIRRGQAEASGTWRSAPRNATPDG